jgi:hypothetical protein
MCPALNAGDVNSGAAERRLLAERGSAATIAGTQQPVVDTH